MRIRPEQLAVALEFRPVIVPLLGAVFGFRDVVIALAVATEVEEFISSARWCGRLQVLDISAETLPKWFGRIRVCGIGAGDEAEVVLVLGRLDVNFYTLQSERPGYVHIRTASNRSWGHPA